MDGRDRRAAQGRSVEAWQGQNHFADDCLGHHGSRCRAGHAGVSVRRGHGHAVRRDGHDLVVDDRLSGARLAGLARVLISRCFLDRSIAEATMALRPQMGPDWHHLTRCQTRVVTVERTF